MTGRHPLNLVSTATTALASLLVLAWLPGAPAVASVSTPHVAPAAVAAAESSPYEISIKPAAALAGGAVKIRAVVPCLDPDGGSTFVTVTVGQVVKGGRVIVGSTAQAAACDTSAGGNVRLAVRPAIGSPGSFHPGPALAVVNVQSCVRSGDDYICFNLEPGWAEVNVTGPTPVTSAPSGLTPDALASRPGLPQPTQVVVSAVDAPVVSLAAVPPVRLIARGAGALLQLRASCDPGEADYGAYQAVTATLQQRFSAVASAGGTVASPAWDKVPCDGLDHVMTLPILSTDGHAFRRGPVDLQATFTATFGSWDDTPPPSIGEATICQNIRMAGGTETVTSAQREI
jgi:hypothetical protein